MKILITENQKHLLRLVGHFSEILDNEFNDYVYNKNTYFCRVYGTPEEFANNTIYRSIETLAEENWDFFHDPSEKGGANIKLTLLVDYAEEKYKGKFINLFNRKCKNQINESKIDFARRLPAVEEELNKQLQENDPTEFDDFQDYISYLARVTFVRLGNDFELRLIPGENYDLYTEFRDHIVYGLRKDIRKIYDSGKPGGLF